MTTVDLAYAPDLIEATVLAALRARPGERAFHRERDAIYEIADPEAREAAFARLHARWFTRLELAAPLREAFGELPEIPERCANAIVTRAVSPRDETADLLVAPGARPTLAIRVRPETLCHAGHALPFLRRELLHVADILDPEFGYAPRLESGSARESLLRARYRVAWDIAVDARLARRGRGAPGARAERWQEFRRAFAELGESAETIFTRVWDADRVTHAELFALAGGTRRLECPLCRLPPNELDGAASLPAAALSAVGADFPWWNPEAGLCRRCAELYQARGTATTQPAQEIV